MTYFPFYSLTIIFSGISQTRVRFILNEMEWASDASEHSEWKGRKNRAKIFHTYPHMVEGWFVCVSVRLCFGKSWMTFEWMDQFGRNYLGLFGWCPVAIGWVVLMTSSHPVGLGLHPVLFPVVNLLCGCWCYWVMAYNFGKQLMRQTNKCEQIFYFSPRPTIVCNAGTDSEGGCNFFENWPIYHNIDPPEIEF